MVKVQQMAMCRKILQQIDFALTTHHLLYLILLRLQYLNHRHQMCQVHIFRLHQNHHLCLRFLHFRYQLHHRQVHLIRPEPGALGPPLDPPPPPENTEHVGPIFPKKGLTSNPNHHLLHL